MKNLLTLASKLPVLVKFRNGCYTTLLHFSLWLPTYLNGIFSQTNIICCNSISYLVRGPWYGCIDSVCREKIKSFFASRDKFKSFTAPPVVFWSYLASWMTSAHFESHNPRNFVSNAESRRQKKSYSAPRHIMSKWVFFIK